MSKLSFLEFLDRRDQRKLERDRLAPPRPRDTRQLIGVLFFAGYYALIWRMMSARDIPPDNLTLIKDAMLILGPVIGAIGQALFRTDAKDEMSTQNTGEFARATTRQAEATIAAASTTPTSTAAADAAGQVADAARDKADQIEETFNEPDPTRPRR